MSLSDLVPLVQTEDGWTVSDVTLTELYFGICSDGTDQTIFFDGSIDSPDVFLEAIKSPSNLTVVFIKDNRPAGFAWLNAITGHTATAHFAFRKFAWGPYAREIGKSTVSYWMSFTTSTGEPMFQVIMGTVPTRNRRAIRYVHDLGFKTVGQIPKLLKGRDGGFHPAEFVYYERV